MSLVKTNNQNVLLNVPEGFQYSFVLLPFVNMCLNGYGGIGNVLNTELFSHNLEMYIHVKLKTEVQKATWYNDFVECWWDEIDDAGPSVAYLNVLYRIPKHWVNDAIHFTNGKLSKMSEASVALIAEHCGLSNGQIGANKKPVTHRLLMAMSKNPKVRAFLKGYLEKELGLENPISDDEELFNSFYRTVEDGNIVMEIHNFCYPLPHDNKW